MNTIDIAQKREELKTVMTELCKSAESDQKLRDQIKDRNFFERLLSNNARDLARAGVAQTEIVEKFIQSFQEFLEVYRDGLEREREFVSVVDELRESNDKVVAEICAGLSKALRAIVKEDIKVKRIDSRVSAGASVSSSEAAARKCVASILEYCKKVIAVDGDEFCKLLVETVRTNFVEKGVALRNEDKQFIARELSRVIGENIEYDQGFGKESVSVELLIMRELEKISPEGDSYAKFRDELVGIIDEFVSHKNDVDPKGKSIPQLLKVKNRLLESQFEIALIGEFQGGKSTTFNALCGGREISPRGLGTGGVKTSAAVITAQNIAGNETRNGLSEWAEITWLSRKALHQRVAYALNFKEQEALPPISELESAVQKAWTNLTVDDDDSRDMLQVATLQLRLLKSKEFDSIVTRNVVAIDEFQKYVKFPKNWEMRWGEQGINADFTMEESLFVALDSVLVRIHSAYLQKLGCRITDCPGLFVSKWDTDRALEVMRRSNAVWYLLNGNKEMAKEQKKVLQSIRLGRWHTKCFFTLNVKGDEASTDGILRANVAKIKNAGFNVANRVFKYNAAVAFRLAQLEWVKGGRFDKRDIDCLAIESANKKIKYEDMLEKLLAGNAVGEIVKAIRKQIYNVLIPTGYSDPDYFDMTDEQLEAALEEFAGLKNIVRSLERHVISHGAASVLLGDAGSGVEFCRRVLNELCTDKKSEEASAKRDSVEAKRKWEESKSRFERFKSSVVKEFRFLDENTKLDDDFLSDFYNCEWKSIHDDAQESAIDVTLEEWHSGHWTNTSVKEAAVRRIKEEFARVFKLKLNAYGERIAQTTIYKNEIGKRIAWSWKELKEEWDEMEKENPHFEGLFPDEDAVEVEINPFNKSIDQSIEVPSYFIEFFRNLFNYIASRLGCKRETSEDRIRNFFKEKDPIKDALDKLRDSYFNSTEFKTLFAQARLQNKGKIETSMAEVESKFNARIKEEKERMAEADEIRQCKAAEARRVREEIIEPRITKLADFKERVIAAYGV